MWLIMEELAACGANPLKYVSDEISILERADDHK
jgi:hypothetical protein